MSNYSLHDYLTWNIKPSMINHSLEKYSRTMLTKKARIIPTKQEKA
jgi:hypothetical protein